MKDEIQKPQPKEQFRVVIDREANDALENIVAKLNQEPGAHKLSKSDVANFVLQRIEEMLGEAEIADIRATYFDPKIALEGILKNGNSLPEEIENALLKHCGIKPTTKEKRAKKISTPKLVDNPKAV